VKKALPYLLILALLVLVIQDADAQCAMCKKVAEGKDPKSYGSVAKNLNSAILYLMTVPYIALAFIFRDQIKSLIRGLRKKQ